MKRYITEPQIPGSLGPKTIYTSTFPTRVSHMHYVLDTWPCDDIIQDHPCYAVSDRVKKEMERQKVTGIKFANCEISLSEKIEKVSDIVAPLFWRLEPCDILKEDISLDAKHRLIVSERAKRLLEAFYPIDCDFEELNNAP